MKNNYICISCPIGCRLELEDTDDQLKITGNKCPRGEIYAREEYLAPKRTVTSTCRIKSEVISRLPVKSDRPVLKGEIEAVLKEIYKLDVVPPVQCGDVLIRDFKNEGINVVATRSIEK